MKTIPVIRTAQDFELWRKNINSLTKAPQKPVIPYNFQVSKYRGGNRLTWTAVTGADGYEILRTTTGDFSAATTVTIEGGEVDRYFDNVAVSGGSIPTIGYKLRATAGTPQQKHSVKGDTTTPCFSQPIDPTDTTTVTATVRDKTSDKDRVVQRYQRRFQ